MTPPAITDAEFDAVRTLAATGRPIPAIVMAAIVERLQAKPDETWTSSRVGAEVALRRIFPTGSRPS